MSHPGLLRIAKNIVWAVCPLRLSLWLEERYYLAFGETELSLIPQLCDPERDAIDVGANRGCYTLFMRKYARHVIAFEPNPKLVDELADKFEPEVSVLSHALSHRNGLASLHVPVVDGEDIAGLASLDEAHPVEAAPGHQIADHEILVPARALDDAFWGDVGFIKIDVEGHEQAVLQGAHTTIERCRPNALVELEERHALHTVDRVRRFFGELDYRGFFVRGGEVLPIERFDANTMQRRQDIETMDIFHVQSPTDRYTNNFLFLPSERSDAVVGRIAEALHPHLRLNFYLHWAHYRG